MQFPTPLLRGTLIQRYKRFLADIRLDSGEVITATCPNTGSMMGLTTPGVPVWVSTSDSPTRKYKHTWEMLEVDLGKGPGLDPAQVSAAGDTAAHEPGALQHADVLGGGGKRHPQRRCQLREVLLTRGQPTQDGPPRRVRQGMKNAIESRRGLFNHMV